MFRNLSGMLKTEKCKEIQQLSTFMQVFMILFYYKERGVKMHKELYNMEQNDLLAAIYFYYSQDTLPEPVSSNIDVTIQELQTNDCDDKYIETTINDMISVVDSHAFYRGFRACLDLMSGNVFRRMMEGLEDDE